MDEKKEEFMNECRKNLRIYTKEFNKAEITNMSAEQRSKEKLEADISAKKTKFKLGFFLNHFYVTSMLRAKTFL